MQDARVFEGVTDMELREALTQIAEIRQQMARGQVFRGYRAATTAFSGLVALVAAIVQRAALPAVRQPTAAGQVAPGAREFVLLWTAAAGICLVAVGIEMVVRTRRSSQVQRQLTLLAVEQFVPSIAAGGLLTWVFFDYMPALYVDVAGALEMILVFVGDVRVSPIAAADGFFRGRRVLPHLRHRGRWCSQAATTLGRRASSCGMASPLG